MIEFIKAKDMSICKTDESHEIGLIQLFTNKINLQNTKFLDNRKNSLLISLIYTKQ